MKLNKYVEKKLRNSIFGILFNAYSKSIYKKIQFVDKISTETIAKLASACVVSSPSAWATFQKLNPTCPTPINLILNPSIQLEEIQKITASIGEDLIVGIGGGRIMDATKALAHLSKISCTLIPSILSTTAWINTTASLKKGPRVHHARGKYNRIIIDSHLIAAAPSHLNFGGLMDLLVGYSGLADMRLKKQLKGRHMSKFAEEKVLNYCNRIKIFMETTADLPPDQIPKMTGFYIEGIANCYGLLSGFPLDAGEHLLYYAIEEKINRPMNHGAIISLCTLICIRLHGSNSDITPKTLQSLMDSCKIKYTLGDLQISPDQLFSILKEMKIFVEKNKYPFSIWNTDPKIEDTLIHN